MLFVPAKLLSTPGKAGLSTVTVGAGIDVGVSDVVAVASAANGAACVRLALLLTVQDDTAVRVFSSETLQPRVLAHVALVDVDVLVDAPVITVM